MSDGPIYVYYPVFLNSKPDGRVQATVPDHPGLSAEGADFDEAMEAIGVPLQERIDWLEQIGHPVPAPTPFTDAYTRAEAEDVEELSMLTVTLRAAPGPPPPPPSPPPPLEGVFATARQAIAARSPAEPEAASEEQELRPLLQAIADAHAEAARALGPKRLYYRTLAELGVQKRLAPQVEAVAAARLDPERSFVQRLRLVAALEDDAFTAWHELELAITYEDDPERRAPLVPIHTAVGALARAVRGRREAIAGDGRPVLAALDAAWRRLIAAHEEHAALAGKDVARWRDKLEAELRTVVEHLGEAADPASAPERARDLEYMAYQFQGVVGGARLTRGDEAATALATLEAAAEALAQLATSILGFLGKAKRAGLEPRFLAPDPETVPIPPPTEPNALRPAIVLAVERHCGDGEALREALVAVGVAHPIDPEVVDADDAYRDHFGFVRSLSGASFGRSKLETKRRRKTFTLTMRWGEQALEGKIRFENDYIEDDFYRFLNVVLEAHGAAARLCQVDGESDCIGVFTPAEIALVTDAGVPLDEF